MTNSQYGALAMTYITAHITIFLKTVGIYIFFCIVKKYIDYKFKKGNDKFIESLKWEAKIRERAASVAEYLALAKDLRGDDSRETYRRANQLAWELTMWLPEDVVSDMIQTLKENTHINTFKTLNTIREILLKNTSTLTAENHFILHAPGIGQDKK